MTLRIGITGAEKGIMPTDEERRAAFRALMTDPSGIDALAASIVGVLRSEGIDTGQVALVFLDLEERLALRVGIRLRRIASEDVGSGLFQVALVFRSDLFDAIGWMTAANRWLSKCQSRELPVLGVGTGLYMSTVAGAVN